MLFVLLMLAFVFGSAVTLFVLSLSMAATTADFWVAGYEGGRNGKMPSEGL